MSRNEENINRKVIPEKVDRQNEKYIGRHHQQSINCWRPNQWAWDEVQKSGEQQKIESGWGEGMDGMMKGNLGKPVAENSGWWKDG